MKPTLLQPISPGETKLLLKTLLFAKTLTQKFNGLSPLKPVFQRRRIMLVAFFLLIRSLKVVDKAIGGTDRFLDLIDLLSYFSFDQASQLLNDPKWIAFVEAKLNKAIKQRYLRQWISSKINRPKIKHFQEFNVFKMEDYLRKPIQNSLMTPAKEYFQSWCLLFRLRKVCNSKLTSLKLSALFAWRKSVLLKQRYEVYYGEGTFLPLSECSLTVAVSYGPRALALHAICEWRAIVKLRSNEIDKYLHGKREVLSFWKRKAEQRQNHCRIAALYDISRTLKVTFYNWHHIANRSRKLSQMALQYEKKRLLEKGLEVWSDRHKGKCYRRRYFARWRGAADFRQRCQFAGYDFYLKKLTLNSLIKWKQKRAKVLALDGICNQKIVKMKREQVETYCHVWRKVLSWINRNSEKMRTLRAVRIAKNTLDHWRIKVKASKSAEIYQSAALTKRLISRWKSRTMTRIVDRESIKDYFTKWRKIFTLRSSLQLYYQEHGFAPEKKSIDFLCDTFSSLKIIESWRKKAGLMRKLDLFQHQNSTNILKEIFVSWRLNTNVLFYLRQKPWRAKKRLWRKWKSFSAEGNKKVASLEGKLSDFVHGREFVTRFQAFERWQQAFQARKMEEHLCGENLKYYNSRRLLKLLQIWKLSTAYRMLQRCKSLNLERKCFNSWSSASRRVVKARKSRICSRYFHDWRDKYRLSASDHLLKGKSRKLSRLYLDRWRFLAKNQSESHRKSTDFINSSSLHYFLQKWRTEAVAKKSSKVKQWSQILSEPPKNQEFRPAVSIGRRPTLTLSTEQMPFYREEESPCLV